MVKMDSFSRNDSFEQALVAWKPESNFFDDDDQFEALMAAWKPECVSGKQEKGAFSAQVKENLGPRRSTRVKKTTVKFGY